MHLPCFFQVDASGLLLSLVTADNFLVFPALHRGHESGQGNLGPHLLFCKSVAGPPYTFS